MSEQHHAGLPPSNFDGIAPLQRPKQDVSCEISDIEGWISNAQRIEVDDAAESTVEQHIAIVQITMYQRASSTVVGLWKVDGDPLILLDQSRVDPFEHRQPLPRGAPIHRSGKVRLPDPSGMKASEDVDSRPQGGLPPSRRRVLDEMVMKGPTRQ